MRVWHFPNLGSKIYFRVEVKEVQDAKDILQLLSDYDLALGELIHSNASGLEIYVANDPAYEGVETNDGWVEWEDDEGRDIWENMRGTK